MSDAIAQLGSISTVIVLIGVILWSLPRLYQLFRRQLQRLKEAVRP